MLVSYIENDTTFYVANIDFLQKVSKKIENAKIDTEKDLDKAEKNAMCFRFYADVWYGFVGRNKRRELQFVHFYKFLDVLEVSSLC